MVATIVCERTADEKYSRFAADKKWCEVKKGVESGPIPRFGETLDSLIDTYLSEYNKKTSHYVEDVRSAEREELIEKVLKLVQASFQSMLEHIRSRTLDEFKKIFATTLNKGKSFSEVSRDCIQTSMSKFREECADAAIKQAKWDISEARDRLLCDMDAHVASVRSAKLSQLAPQYEAELKVEISGPLVALLGRADDDTWKEIRNLLRCKTESIVSRLSVELSCFDVDEQTKSKMLASLKNSATAAVAAKAREESKRVLSHMKDRFDKMVGFNTNSVPRVWTGCEDIQLIVKDAHFSSLKVLSVMAAIRLDDGADNIENTLSHALLDSTNCVVTSLRVAAVDPLALNTWGKVQPSETLIKPYECKSYWSEFLAKAENTVRGETVSLEKAATQCCEKIVNDMVSGFAANKEWCQVKRDLQSGPILSFKERLDSLINTCLSEYDEEAACFVENVRCAKRKKLEPKLLQLLRPAYHSMLGHIRSTVINKFKENLDENLNAGRDIHAATESCTQSSVNLFNQKCQDAGIDLTHCDVNEAKFILQKDIFIHLSRVVTSQMLAGPVEYNNVPAEDIKYEKMLAANNEVDEYKHANDEYDESNDANDEYNDPNMPSSSQGKKKSRRRAFLGLLRGLAVMVATIFGFFN